MGSDDFWCFLTCSTQKRIIVKMSKDPGPGGPCESRSSKDHNYCSAAKTSQKNPTISLPSEELIAMLNSSLWGRKKSKAGFPFHTLNRVTAIYEAPPAFSTNLDQMQLQLCSALSAITGHSIYRAKKWIGFFYVWAAIARVIAGHKTHKTHHKATPGRDAVHSMFLWPKGNTCWKS